jgi:hypothetical protein
MSQVRHRSIHATRGGNGWTPGRGTSFECRKTTEYRANVAVFSVWLLIVAAREYRLSVSVER